MRRFESASEKATHAIADHNMFDVLSYAGDNASALLPECLADDLTKGNHDIERIEIGGLNADFDIVRTESLLVQWVVLKLENIKKTRDRTHQIQSPIFTGNSPFLGDSRLTFGFGGE